MVLELYGFDYKKREVKGDTGTHQTILSNLEKNRTN